MVVVVRMVASLIDGGRGGGDSGSGSGGGKSKMIFLYLRPEREM